MTRNSVAKTRERLKKLKTTNKIAQNEQNKLSNNQNVTINRRGRKVETDKPKKNGEKDKEKKPINVEKWLKLAAKIQKVLPKGNLPQKASEILGSDKFNKEGTNTETNGNNNANSETMKIHSESKQKQVKTHKATTREKEKEKNKNNGKN